VGLLSNRFVWAATGDALHLANRWFVLQALVHAKLDHTYEKLRVSTYGIMFFGTPHQGGNHARLGDVIASVARYVLRNPSNTLMEALKRDSILADILADSFRHQLEDYQMISCYETRPQGKTGLVCISHLDSGHRGTLTMEVGC